MNEYKFYLVEKRPPIAWVYLNRPHKKNAMDPPAWKETTPIFDDLDRDPEIRAVILTGNGSCFCAGIDLMAVAADIPELMEPTQRGGVKWRLLPQIARMQETMSCIDRCRKPVIAAVHNHCIGAGLDMIASCDIRLCSADAKFALKEAAMGIVADVGGLQRLPHIVGHGITRELAFTAKTIDAARAKEINLVNGVYKNHSELLEAAEKMALEIAENSPLAVQAAKDVLNTAWQNSIESGLKYVASISANIIPSGDLMEAVSAFAEKRKPKFKGE